jgi:hypothetical protein
MPSPRYRVTNAQRAAVCALVIAGQPFGPSCQIVDAPWRRMRELVPRDYSKPGNYKRPKWHGDLLKELEDAYRDRNLHVDTIAAMFGIQRRQIAHLAARHGWPRRKGSAKNRLPIPLREMPTKQLSRYRKLRRILGRTAAQQAVFGVSP